MWIGCARIAYGARNATKQNWYATTPPSTWLPITSAAPSRTATSCCSTTHAESQQQPAQLAVDGRRGWRAGGSPTAGARPSARPRSRRTPSVPPIARISFSGRGEVEIGGRPVHDPEHGHRGDEHHGVGDRRHRDDHEPALGEEHGGGHGPDHVEQHLRDEEAQEEGRQLDLLRLDVGVRGAARQQAGDRRRAARCPPPRRRAITASARPEHARRPGARPRRRRRPGTGRRRSARARPTAPRRR